MCIKESCPGCINCPNSDERDERGGCNTLSEPSLIDRFLIYSTNIKKKGTFVKDLNALFIKKLMRGSLGFAD